MFIDAIDGNNSLKKSRKLEKMKFALEATLVNLLVALLASNSTSATNNAIYDTTRKAVLDMLANAASGQAFAKAMSTYQTAYRVNFASVDFDELRNFYEAYFAAFSAPCNLNALRAYKSSLNLRRAAQSSDLQQTVDFLLTKKPIEKYVEKCIVEFDALSSELFSLNHKPEVLVASLLESAASRNEALLRISGKLKTQELMSSLAKLVWRATGASLSFEELEADLSLSAPQNDKLMQLFMQKSSQVALTCLQANNSRKLQSMKQVMREILSSANEVFKSQATIRALSLQLEAVEPNAVKILSLATFCAPFAGDFLSQLNSFRADFLMQGLNNNENQ